MALLRDRGCIVAKVEQTIPHSFIKRDAFGFGDLLIASVEFGTGLVQVTTGSHLANRAQKAMAIPALWSWLEAGGRFLLHGWVKRATRWEVIEREAVLTRGMIRVLDAKWPLVPCPDVPAAV